MSRLEEIKDKVVDRHKLKETVAKLKSSGEKVVFTNGCFDIVHRGHIEYLVKASELGDRLIIGLNTDSSVRKIKGDSRPVQDETSRSLILAAMSFVDYVVLFDEETPYELIKLLVPDILVKGADYKIEEIVGADIVSAGGGKIVTIEFVKGYSSSSILGRL